MKKLFTWLLLFSFILVGCNQKNDVKGESDIKGVILEVNKEVGRILVEDVEKGLVWITLKATEDINKFQPYQEVAVWVEGAIAESYPSQAKALHVEIIPPKEAVTTSAEAAEGDFIYRIVTENAEYKENNPVKLYAELEYVGDQEEITIYHASSVFHFPMIEKTRDIPIDYAMNQPLVSTIMKKGEPLRERYNGSGGYAEEDEKELKQFMKRIMENQFPAGDYLVSGFADFYINTDEEEQKDFKIRAQIAFKVK
ncbi:DUF3221 domain-containing protein [Bacillus sp. DTU_2020_1000418_1_SI_GHA_SEK_038]|uniref:DUF3221 domain-containing protein n=1 Tax=Bacillus sp. DTU_2020_1000418_1_SI_GHA_SEK_038 TaxID=3077585 RepID=UPI0028E21100|nr:DUF3221 domain-containing protein [Bacillus sp. DTU_2020_1000418_1_SI_GHA_SEK_038]WNS75800.1 DUF3221 domain-containing protein [Bacillus sp. DTU_2020_1000418_1_SI_GHA_SEK_038]